MTIQDIHQAGYQTVPASAMRVYVEICKRADEGGPMLSYEQIAAKLGWKSRNSVMQCVDRLQEAGMVSFEKNAAKTVRPKYRMEMYS